MKNQKIAWFLVIFSPFILYLIMNLDIEINNIIIRYIVVMSLALCPILLFVLGAFLIEIWQN